MLASVLNVFKFGSAGSNDGAGYSGHSAPPSMDGGDDDDDDPLSAATEVTTTMTAMSTSGVPLGEGVDVGVVRRSSGSATSVREDAATVGGGGRGGGGMPRHSRQLSSSSNTGGQSHDGAGVVDRRRVSQLQQQQQHMMAGSGSGHGGFSALPGTGSGPRNILPGPFASFHTRTWSGGNGGPTSSSHHHHHPHHHRAADDMEGRTALLGGGGAGGGRVGHNSLLDDGEDEHDDEEYHRHHSDAGLGGSPSRPPPLHISHSRIASQDLGGTLSGMHSSRSVVGGGGGMNTRNASGGGLVGTRSPLPAGVASPAADGSPNGGTTGSGGAGNRSASGGALVGITAAGYDGSGGRVGGGGGGSFDDVFASGGGLSRPPWGPTTTSVSPPSSATLGPGSPPSPMSTQFSIPVPLAALPAVAPGRGTVSGAPPMVVTAPDALTPLVRAPPPTTQPNSLPAAAPVPSIALRMPLRRVVPVFNKDGAAEGHYRGREEQGFGDSDGRRDAAAAAAGGARGLQATGLPPGSGNGRGAAGTLIATTASLATPAVAPCFPVTPRSHSNNNNNNNSNKSVHSSGGSGNRNRAPVGAAADLLDFGDDPYDDDFSRSSTNNTNNDTSENGGFGGGGGGSFQRHAVSRRLMGRSTLWGVTLHPIPGSATKAYIQGVRTALRTNDLTALKRLTADPQLDVNIGDPLKWAVKFRRAEALEIFLRHPRINPNRPGGIPLYEAVLANDLECVNALLCHDKICVNLFPRSRGTTALCAAIDRGYKGIATMLLLHDRTNRNSGGWIYTPLQHCILAGDASTLQLLLMLGGVIASSNTSSGFSSGGGSVNVGTVTLDVNRHHPLTEHPLELAIQRVEDLRMTWQASISAASPSGGALRGANDPLAALNGSTSSAMGGSPPPPPIGVAVLASPPTKRGDAYSTRDGGAPTAEAGGPAPLLRRASLSSQSSLTRHHLFHGGATTTNTASASTAEREESMPPLPPPPGSVNGTVSMTPAGGDRRRRLGGGNTTTTTASSTTHQNSSGVYDGAAGMAVKKSSSELGLGGSTEGLAIFRRKDDDEPGDEGRGGEGSRRFGGDHGGGTGESAGDGNSPELCALLAAEAVLDTYLTARTIRVPQALIDRLEREILHAEVAAAEDAAGGVSAANAAILGISTDDGGAAFDDLTGTAGRGGAGKTSTAGAPTTPSPLGGVITPKEPPPPHPNVAVLQRIYDAAYRCPQGTLWKHRFALFVLIGIYDLFYIGCWIWLLFTTLLSLQWLALGVILFMTMAFVGTMVFDSINCVWQVAVLTVCRETVYGMMASSSSSSSRRTSVSTTGGGGKNERRTVQVATRKEAYRQFIARVGRNQVFAVILIIMHAVALLAVDTPSYRAAVTRTTTTTTMVPTPPPSTGMTNVTMTTTTLITNTTIATTTVAPEVTLPPAATPPVAFVATPTSNDPHSPIGARVAVMVLLAVEFLAGFFLRRPDRNGIDALTAVVALVVTTVAGVGAAVAGEDAHHGPGGGGLDRPRGDVGGALADDEDDEDEDVMMATEESELTGGGSSSQGAPIGGPARDIIGGGGASVVIRPGGGYGGKGRHPSVGATTTLREELRGDFEEEGGVGDDGGLEMTADPFTASMVEPGGPPSVALTLPPLRISR